MVGDNSIRCAQPADVDALAVLTHECVQGGASIGFMANVSMERLREFWEQCLNSAVRGERIVLVAEIEQVGVVGTVQLVPAGADNQPHRADVAKLQVHPEVRGQGIAAKLMKAIEREACRKGKWLLVLDTVSGSTADRLYRRLGWSVSGEIPDYALWPDESLCATTVFYKKLSVPSDV